MIGAILGDIIGSPYEFHPMEVKSKDFPLFTKASHYTDDTAMTIAIANSILDKRENQDKSYFAYFTDCMRYYGNKYALNEYGGMFKRWLTTKNPKPYKSYGNGSAMRVSPVGWLCSDLEQTENLAQISAMVTHNHSEGIKGARAVAGAIWMARNKVSKDFIKGYIMSTYRYNLNKTCDEIRPTYTFNETCQETVPQAITAFLEGNSFEDCIRNAVSLGGDCDTLTCITGSIAEAYYGVPKKLKKKCLEYLPEEFIYVIERFERSVENGTE